MQEQKTRVTELLKRMKDICESYSRNISFHPPVTEETLARWEAERHARLCPELRELYLFTNGVQLQMCGSLLHICPLEKLAFQEGGIDGYPDSEDYMEIGQYVGDGAVLCVDRDYHFFSGQDGEIEPDALEDVIASELGFLEERIASNRK